MDKVHQIKQGQTDNEYNWYRYISIFKQRQHIFAVARWNHLMVIVLTILEL